MKNYYIYIYLDPRKPGIYKYPGIKFNYKPFYVGKGKNQRWQPKQHFYKYHNHVENKIKKIGIDNIIIMFVKGRFTNQTVLHCEVELISSIGRQDLNNGPLVNLTSGGENYVRSIQSIELLREAIKLGYRNGRVPWNKGKKLPNISLKNKERKGMKYAKQTDC